MTPDGDSSVLVGSETVAVITPRNLEKDSRALRQVNSLDSWGYVVHVLEGEPAQVVENTPELLKKVHRVGAQLTEMPTLASEVDLTKERQQEMPDSGVQRAISAFKRTWLGDLFRQCLVCLMRSPLGVVFDWAAYLKITLNYIRMFLFRPWKLLPKADVYIVHSYEFVPLALAKGALYRAPVIYDVHDLYGRIFEDLDKADLGADRWWSKIIRFCQWLAFSRCSAVTTVGEKIAEELQRQHGRLPVVLRSVHDARLDVEATTHDTPFDRRTPSDFLLVVVGENRPGQSVGQALEAFVGLASSVKCVFVGRGYEEWLEKIEVLGLQDRVYLAGPAPSWSIVPLIRKADASLILDYDFTINSQVSLPNRFLHSIAAGLPILYPALPEIVAIAGTYDLGVLINPIDPISIKRGIESLSGDNKRYSTCRANADRASAELNWQVEERKFEELLDLVKRGHRCEGDDVGIGREAGV